MFQVGWFNHQLAKHVALLFRVALEVVRVFGWLSSNLMTRSHFDGNMDPAFFEQSDSTTEPSESRYVPRKGLLLRSYSQDGIGTLNSILGRGLDSKETIRSFPHVFFDLPFIECFFVVLFVYL